MLFFLSFFNNKNIWKDKVLSLSHSRYVPRLLQFFIQYKRVAWNTVVFNCLQTVFKKKANAFDEVFLY
jgi:hypothetical protein